MCIRDTYWKFICVPCASSSMKCLACISVTKCISWMKLSKSNTTDVTTGACTEYPSGAYEFILCLWWCSFWLIFTFLCSCYRSLFVIFLKAILFSIIRFTPSDYPFKFFLRRRIVIEYCSYVQVLLSYSWNIVESGVNNHNPNPPIPHV